MYHFVGWFLKKRRVTFILSFLPLSYKKSTTDWLDPAQFLLLKNSLDRPSLEHLFVPRLTTFRMHASLEYVLRMYAGKLKLRFEKVVALSPPLGLWTNEKQEYSELPLVLVVLATTVTSPAVVAVSKWQSAPFAIRYWNLRFQSLSHKLDSTCVAVLAAVQFKKSNRSILPSDSLASLWWSYGEKNTKSYLLLVLPLTPPHICCYFDDHDNRQHLSF